MLKEQAISLLTQVKNIILGSESWLDTAHQPIEEAFGMAIEALKSTQPNAPNTLNALDCISRQTAIDELDGTKVDEEDCTEYDIGYNDGIDFAISKLSVLPSAQPEQKKGRKNLYEQSEPENSIIRSNEKYLSSVEYGIEITVSEYES